MYESLRSEQGTNVLTDSRSGGRSGDRQAAISDLTSPTRDPCPLQRTVEEESKAFRFPASIPRVRDKSIATKYKYIQYLRYPGINLITHQFACN